MRPKRTTRATTRRAERARDLRHRGAQEIEQIVCPARGKMTQAPLPEEVEGQFGPQLTALIAHLTVVCRLPRSVVQRLLEGALQIPISLGST